MRSVRTGTETRGGLRAWCLLSAVEGCGAALWLLLLPGEGRISAARLGMAGAALLGALLFLYMWRVFNDAERVRSWASILSRIPLRAALLAGGLLVVFFATQFIHLALTVTDPSVRAPLARLLPFFAWGLALGVQMLVILPFLRIDNIGSIWKTLCSEIRPALVLFAVLLVMWGFVAWSGLGVRPDVIGWHDPGAPLLPLQALAAWATGVFLFLLSLPLRKRNWIFDVAAAFLLWGAAVWLWQAQPLTPNYFALKPGPPNYEFTPYSDASGYDLTAQRLATGMGYGWMPLKPLYALFLGALHAGLGQDYAAVVDGQIVLLALFPVVLYFLGSLLHHRLTGLIAAGSIILREANAIQLSGLIRVAHAKLLLSDLPTAFLIALFTLAVVYWLLKARESLGFPLLIGALLGALSLVRPQTMIFAPFVALFALILFIRRPKHALLAAMLIGLGTLLGMSGWLFRTWRTTGSPVLNDPAQTAYMTAVYHPHPDAQDLYVNALQPELGENEASYNRRIQNAVRDFVMTYPLETLRFISAHTLHNEIESLLVLPVSPWIVQNGQSPLFPRWREQMGKLWQDCCSPAAYVEAQPFWKGWQGDLPLASALMLGFSLYLFSLGVCGSWQRVRAAALFPLLINLIYTLSCAVGRQSGWRFTLPADWVIFLFAAAGVVQVMLWLRPLYFGETTSGAEHPESAAAHASGRRFTWLLGLGAALCIGWAPAFAEGAFPLRADAFPAVSAWESARQVEERFEQAGVSLSGMEAGGMDAYQGVLLYPRYYRAGQGESPDGAAAFVPRPNARLGFVLLTDHNLQGVLALPDAPDRIPAAAAALVIGCHEGKYMDVRALLVKETGELILRDPALDWKCTPASEGVSP